MQEGGGGGHNVAMRTQELPVDGCGTTATATCCAEGGGRGTRRRDGSRAQELPVDGCSTAATVLPLLCRLVTSHIDDPAPCSQPDTQYQSYLLATFASTFMRGARTGGRRPSKYAMGSGLHIASATAQRNRVRRAHNSGVTPAGKEGDAALEESGPLLLPVAAPLRPSCALGHTNREDGEGRRWVEWRESSLASHCPSISPHGKSLCPLLPTHLCSTAWDANACTASANRPAASRRRRTVTASSRPTSAARSRMHTDAATPQRTIKFSARRAPARGAISRQRNSTRAAMARGMRANAPGGLFTASLGT